MSSMEITTMVGCPLMCTFCPQDPLKKAYGKDSDKYMSLENFATILGRIPKHVRIDFSGMAEPWANPDTTKMLEMALQQGRLVGVYTTLYGITVEDSQRIVELLAQHVNQVAVLCLHLPDDNMNMRGYKGSDEYRQVFKNVLTMVANGAFPMAKFQAMTMDKSGHVHRDLQDILPQLGPWNGHARAGSLERQEVEKTGARKAPFNHFPLSCASTPFYDHNVVLPNGDVVLCCMDYALKHIVGNLLRDDYWNIFTSPEMTKIRLENQKPEFSKCTLCKTCENVVKHRMNEDAAWLPGEYTVPN